MAYNQKSDFKPKFEQGITPTVQTIFSQITVKDIINYISCLKAQAIISWMEKTNLSGKILIFGTYITGFKVANLLVKNYQVTVVDIHPHLKYFLDEKVSFRKDITELDSAETFEVIIDTTGIGGIDLSILDFFNAPKVLLVENPTSDGSDNLIKSFDETLSRLKHSSASRKGYLFTHGLNSKTSGTMTLTMEVLRRSMRDVLCKEGVLYAVPSLDFYERILFQEKNPEKYLKSIQRPAMVVSSLDRVDCDHIIRENLEKINSVLVESKD
ncbi:SAM-dependent methyltransferase HcgC family protein [Methanobacterium movens]